MTSDPRDVMVEWQNGTRKVLRAEGHRLSMTWSGEYGKESSSTGSCLCGWTESASAQDIVREEYRWHIATVIAKEEARMLSDDPVLREAQRKNLPVERDPHGLEEYPENEGAQAWRIILASERDHPPRTTIDFWIRPDRSTRYALSGVFENSRDTDKASTAIGWVRRYGVGYTNL